MDTYSDILHRVEVLERRASDQEATLNDQATSIQAINEEPTPLQQFDHQNCLVGGDFDFSRNAYLYLTDVVGTGGVDADVSEECYSWFVSSPDVSVETTGSISAGSPTLTIDDPLFVGGDSGKQIVVVGAGAAGADLITTISGAPGSTTTATLALNAGTNVSHGRVRFRLLTLLEDSTDADADANQATNTTLKNASHTLHSPTASDWDKANGWARLSYGDWLCQPLRQNLIRPGNNYIVPFIYKLDRSLDTLDSWPVTVFAGIWDATSGQQKFLEGDPITLNATVEGAPGSTTSRTYFVVFYTNWGESIGTSQATVSAPTTFTNTQYVALSWNQPAGVVRTEIYRKTGATYELLNNPYPQSSYLDKGAIRRTGSGFPAVDRARQRAYIKTTVHNMPDAQTAAWLLQQLKFAIPKEYNKAKTTGKQWFVFGVADALGSIADATRALLVDKLSIDDKFGTFSRSPWDFDAKRGITSNPTGGDQGGSGGGGDPIDPGDTGYCPTFDMPVKVMASGQAIELRAIDLIDNEDIYLVVNRQGIPCRYKAEVSPKPQVIYKLTAPGTMLTASQDEPVAIDEVVEYKALKELVNGDMICTENGLVPVESNLRQVKKRHVVKISLIDSSERGFWAGGVAIHNRKPLEVS